MDPEHYSKINYNLIINKRAYDKYSHVIKWGTTPESIIEVGIGDGKVTKHIIMPMIPNEIKEYVGIDLSKDMLEFSKTVINFPKYETFQMDISSSEMPRKFLNRFDKAFSLLVFHLVNSKLKQALHNLYNVLKPGGQLTYCCFEHLPMNEAFEKLDKTKWSKYQHSRYMSPFWDKESQFEEYKKLTKETGFQEDIFTLLDEVEIRFPNEQLERGVMKSANFVLKDVLPEDCQEYVEDYMRFYQSSSTYSIDQKTGERVQKLRLIVAVVTKPQ